mgnify:CR=1 FL=1
MPIHCELVKNRGERLREFEGRAVKTRDAVEGFDEFENSHTRSTRFSPGFEGKENMFYYNNKQKDDIRSACVAVIFLMSFLCFIVYKPIETHVLSELFYNRKLSLKAE